MGKGGVSLRSPCVSFCVVKVRCSSFEVGKKQDKEGDSPGDQGCNAILYPLKWAVRLTEISGV